CCPDFCGAGVDVGVVCVCCGVGVGVGCVCAKNLAGHNATSRAKAGINRVQVIALGNTDEWPTRAKNISACLFEWFYSSIDARTPLFRGLFRALVMRSGFILKPWFARSPAPLVV